MLRPLGLSVTPAGDGWDVVAPTFRVDLLREVDLIEEVGRHYGLDRIDPTFPPMTASPPQSDSRIARDELARRVLTAAGLTEAITFGFIEAKMADAFAPQPSSLVRVANPLSAQFDTLRPSLLPGLVRAVAHNRRHGRRDAALFEIGACFASVEGESRHVGAGVDRAWLNRSTGQLVQEKSTSSMSKGRLSNYPRSSARRLRSSRVARRF